MARLLRALPPYAGGKRRLLGAIFGAVPASNEAPVFADAFLGGGSVSLMAKARGYRVLCNDVAERSVIVGRALIANSTAQLTELDLAHLFLPQDQRRFAEDTLAPDVFPPAHARFLDHALAHSEELLGPKRWLAKLLVLKVALRLRPMGNFGAKTIVRQAVAGAWEDMNPHYVRDLASRGISQHPLRIAEQIRRQVNGGVFSNGHINEVHQGDAIEFLGAVQADIAYLDPPYAGTQSYEQSLRPLDELLAGRRLEVTPSRFSTADPKLVLDPLLAAAQRIDTVVLSYGNRSIDLGELMDVVRRHRPSVEGRAIRYAHCTGLASQESKARNQELLIVARRTS